MPHESLREGEGNASSREQGSEGRAQGVEVDQARLRLPFDPCRGEVGEELPLRWYAREDEPRSLAGTLLAVTEGP
ncbi:MAG: hypothetical protein HY720_12660 [Planctomycetes bacterium]|nr:hypothetical protein [Planctomycetota bacterium]